MSGLPKARDGKAMKVKLDHRLKSIRCFMKGCSNNVADHPPGVAFFRFPPQPDSRKLWLEICGRDPSAKLPVNARVCSCHFASCLEEVEAGKRPRGRQLHKGEVPYADLPAHASKRKVWEKLCDGGKLRKCPKVCSTHFPKKQLLVMSRCTKLRHGAVPDPKLNTATVQEPKQRTAESAPAPEADSAQTSDPDATKPLEFYLDLVIEKPKPSAKDREKPAVKDRGEFHNYAEQPDDYDEPPDDYEEPPDDYADEPDSNVEWEANKENNGNLPTPISITVTKLPTPTKWPAPGRPSNQARAAARVLSAKIESPASRAKSVKVDSAAQLELNLPSGEMTKYLIDMRAKQQQIIELQNNYNSLVEKVQFRNLHPDWSEEIPASSLSKSPILTLRDGQVERDPPLEQPNLFSMEMLMPLAPKEAWRAVVLLRKQIMDLQVALMYSRIQVKFRELRLQEVTAEHRRFKASIKVKQRKADKEEQNRNNRIQQLEKRCDMVNSNCSEWRLKTKMAEKTGNKKKRRSELLAKGLEQIFTPMQLRVIRTGKKPRWGEEDIRRAIELKKLVTRRGYAFIRNTMKIPLPSPMIMKRGANKFESLKPIYEQMVTANLLKYSTKKKPKIPKKDDHAYDVDLQQFEGVDLEAVPIEGEEGDLQVDLKPGRKKRRVEEDVSPEPSTSEPAQKKPVKRRKKRVVAQAPLEVTLETHGVAGQAFGAEATGVVGRAYGAGTSGVVGRTFGSPPTAPVVKQRRNAAWSDVRARWEAGLWEETDQGLDEFGQPVRDERRQRVRPSWSADAVDFL